MNVLQEKGVKVLLCADSQGRESYILNDDEKDQLWKDGCLIKDDLTYWKTDYRLDDIDKNCTNKVLQGISEDNNIVIFVHESKLTAKYWKYFHQICEGLVIAGYHFI